MSTTDSNHDVSTPDHDLGPAPKMVWPTLVYADARRAITFLVEALGFVETLTVPGEGDDVVHAELRHPEGGGVMLGTAGRHGSVIDGLPAGVGSAYLVVDDPDALHARATAAGATVVRELEDTDYGSRDFTVRDPEGVFWNVGTYRGA